MITAHSQKSQSSQAKRVLIIEDESLMSLLLEETLARLGYEVSATCSYMDDATEAIRKGGFDVAIVDINIHGEYSYDLAPLLEQKEIPFIFSTAYSKGDIPVKFHNYPTLQKPYSLTKLQGYLDGLFSATAK